MLVSQNNEKISENARLHSSYWVSGLLTHTGVVPLMPTTALYQILFLQYGS